MNNKNYFLFAGLTIFVICAYLAYLTTAKNPAINSTFSQDVVATPKAKLDSNSALATYDGGFYLLSYPKTLMFEESSASDVFYLQTIGWTTNNAAKKTSYSIEIYSNAKSVETTDDYVEAKMEDPGYPGFSNAKIEKYKQNGFDVVKATWPDLSVNDHAYGGQINYYFYKDGKAISLAGYGQDSSYIEQVANSITSK